MKRGTDKGTQKRMMKDRPNKRNTIQKQLVLLAIGQLQDHPTAEDVYKQILLSYPGISKATVYRNLGTLVEDGTILKLSVPCSADKYDRTTRAHYHAICNVCGKFVDLKTENPPHINIEDSTAEDFKIEECVILFKGTCRDCKNPHMENPPEGDFNRLKNKNQRREET